MRSKKVNESILSFGVNLNKRLSGKNLSKIATELQIPKSLLHDWVKGKRLPAFKNLSHLQSLSQFLGCTLEELLTGKTSDNSLLSSVLFKDENRSYRIKIERLD